jgi:hypothetical protein
MKISERSVKRLGEIITGDRAMSPYRSGPKLVGFFNDFGTNLSLPNAEAIPFGKS